MRFLFDFSDNFKFATWKLCFFITITYFSFIDLFFLDSEIFLIWIIKKKFYIKFNRHYRWMYSSMVIITIKHLQMNEMLALNSPQEVGMSLNKQTNKPN